MIKQVSCHSHNLSHQPMGVKSY